MLAESQGPEFRENSDILPGTSTAFTFIFRPYHNTRIAMSVTNIFVTYGLCSVNWTRNREALGSKLFETTLS
jgi:hypothetical protein